MSVGLESINIIQSSGRGGEGLIPYLQQISEEEHRSLITINSNLLTALSGGWPSQCCCPSTVQWAY